MVVVNLLGGCWRAAVTCLVSCCVVGFVELLDSMVVLCSLRLLLTAVSFFIGIGTLCGA